MLLSCSLGGFLCGPAAFLALGDPAADVSPGLRRLASPPAGRSVDHRAVGAFLPEHSALGDERHIGDSALGEPVRFILRVSEPFDRHPVMVVGEPEAASGEGI